MSPSRKRPEKTEPAAPKKDVRQDAEHDEADFFRDLEKATSNRARKKLGLPSPRG
jgi:hypothetical protein